MNILETVDALNKYAENRMCEPVSGIGGTGVSLTALLTMDPHTLQFWVIFGFGVAQILLPEFKWFKKS